MIEVESLGLSYYVNCINCLEPFSLVRYGDGEWHAVILRDKTLNCDRNSLKIPGLVRDLEMSLRQPHLDENYIMSLRVSSFAKLSKVKTWLETEVPSQVQWKDCTMFYKASRNGKLNTLVKALRELEIPLVFVGPAHLQKLAKFFPKARFIVTPNSNCYMDKVSILTQVLAVEQPAFFSFSAGPAAKVFIYQLFQAIGEESFLVDFGSLWSVYCGHKIRSYHSQITLELIERNFK